MNIIDFGKIQTSHVGLQKTLAEIKKVATGFGSFLIFGEVGTGRRLLAQLIHESSTRAHSKLTVYRTDELSSFESTVVLIPELQFLSFRDQEILSERMLSADAQTIWLATAQSDFHDLVKRGLIRKDLAAQFQKQIKMPSLEARSGDRVHLMEHILMTLSWVTGKVLRLSPEAQEFLCEFQFKENIKGLEETLEKAAMAAKTSVIELEHLGPQTEAQQSAVQISTLAEMERKLILQTLQITQNNKSQAARLLGISIRTLRNKLSLYREELSEELFQEASYE